MKGDKDMDSNRILVSRTSRGYFAQFVGPHAQDIRDLFDTDTLPCPFGPKANVVDVVAAIRAGNEDRDVEILLTGELASQ